MRASQGYIDPLLKKNKVKENKMAEEMAQQLRACIAVPEDPSSIPCILLPAKMPVTTAPGDTLPLGSMGTSPHKWCTLTQTQTHIHMIKNNKFFFRKKKCYSFPYLWPYYPLCTCACLISEAKQGWGWSVLGWEISHSHPEVGRAGHEDS